MGFKQRNCDFYAVKRIRGYVTNLDVQAIFGLVNIIKNTLNFTILSYSSQLFDLWIVFILRVFAFISS